MGMKLWQLDSILCFDYGKQRDLTSIVAAKNKDWETLVPFFRNIFKYYDSASKDVLDAELPKDFVVEVLRQSRLVCYKFYDGSLRSYTYEDFDGEIIPATDVYLRYGGDVLERVFDRSSAGDSHDFLEFRKILGTDKTQ